MLNRTVHHKILVPVVRNEAGILTGSEICDGLGRSVGSHYLDFALAISVSEALSIIERVSLGFRDAEQEAVDPIGGVSGALDIAFA